MKRISDQTITIKEMDTEAETAEEIRERKGFRSRDDAYKYMDELKEQGWNIVSCRAWRTNRAGTRQRREAYYIKED